jgi:hypothetical protein
MSDAKFSNYESLSKERGMSVIVDDATETMRIFLQPDYTLQYFLIFISVILTALTTLFLVYPPTKEVDADMVMWVMTIIFLFGYSLYEIYQKRIVHCIITKPSGIIRYFRGGVLGSRFDEREIDCLISNITGFEMKRYPFSGRNRFQICAIINNKERLDLSGTYLSFSDCQMNAGIIQKFVNPDLPLIAVDY